MSLGFDKIAKSRRLYRDTLLLEERKQYSYQEIREKLRKAMLIEQVGWTFQPWVKGKLKTVLSNSSTRWSEETSSQPKGWRFQF